MGRDSSTPAVQCKSSTLAKNYKNPRLIEHTEKCHSHIVTSQNNRETKVRLTFQKVKMETYLYPSSPLIFHIKIHLNGRVQKIILQKKLTLDSSKEAALNLFYI